jgi:hypothetical protein
LTNPTLSLTNTTFILTNYERRYNTILKHTFEKTRGLSIKLESKTSFAIGFCFGFLEEMPLN